MTTLIRTHAILKGLPPAGPILFFQEWKVAFNLTKSKQLPSLCLIAQPFQHHDESPSGVHQDVGKVDATDVGAARAQSTRDVRTRLVRVHRLPPHGIHCELASFEKNSLQKLLLSPKQSLNKLIYERVGTVPISQHIDRNRCLEIKELKLVSKLLFTDLAWTVA